MQVIHIFKKIHTAIHEWFTSIIPAIQEAQIKRTVVQGQPGHKSKTLSPKYPT
jgi:hypothetical protein